MKTRLAPRACQSLLLGLALTGCVGEASDDPSGDDDLPVLDPPDEAHDRLLADPELPDRDLLEAPAPGMTVDQVARTYCSTAPVRQLSEQLIAEIECMRPGTMARLDALPGVRLSSTTFPFLQATAAAALGRAAQVVTLDVSSALRTTAQQYVLYSWYVNGRCTDVVSLAAPPGRSNHEAGLAVDLAQAGSVRSVMAGRSWSWLGGSDPVHYDYVGAGVDLRPYAVKAFQRLWNRNHPGAAIAEDGVYTLGGATEAALRQAPAAGFPLGASCGAPTDPVAALEVYWARESDGRYRLHALAPAAVATVTYKVDGYPIASSSRVQGDNFPASYLFTQGGTARRFEIDGHDASGRRVAHGVGLIDVTDGTAVYVRQLGAGLYEIGLERAPAGLAAVEVRADGYLLTDAVSGTTRSTRLAVRSHFGQLGPRAFQITTYNPDGSVRGSLARALTLE